MAVSATSLKCRKCGAGLPAGETTGSFCARCLLGAVLPSRSESAAGRTATPSSAPDGRPARIGDYDILGEIARGGMGVVYKAVDTRVGRTVALKMILAESLGDISLRRFQGETSAAAALDHPNIVPIYEVGEVEGRPFFTMKLIEGGSLSVRLPAFHQSLRQGAALLAKVARAVHHAHQRGVLHRDLKPSNILVNEEGEPFVTDFGLARRFDDQNSLTLTGTLIGTPNFIAPELLAGTERALTMASDVFSLGAILYNILTGRPPFHSDNLMELLHGVQHAEPQGPAQLNPQVDRDLETICLKCLEKDPRNRYRSALELAEDLERWLGHDTIIARRATPFERGLKWARRRPLVAALSAAVVVAVIGGVVGIYLQWQEAEAARRTAEANRNAEKLAKEEAQRHQGNAEAALRDTAAMLTDSELERADLLFAAGNSPGGLAYLARVLRRDPANVVAASRIIAFLRQRQVTLPEIIAPSSEAHVLAAALAPDGKRLVAAADLPQNNLRVTHLDPGMRFWAATHPYQTLMDASQRNPNSFFVNSAPVRLPGPLPDADGFRLANSSAARPRLPIIAGFFSVNFSPDGKKIVSGANTGTVRVWDADTGEALTTVLSVEAPVMNAAITRDGRSVVAIGRNGTLRVWEIASGELVQDFFTCPVVLSAWFNLEASQVVLVRPPGVAQMWDIPTATDTYAIQHEGQVRQVAWSRDGQSVAAATDAEVVVWNATSASPEGLRLPHPQPVATLALSTDGRKLVTGSDDPLARLWDTTTGQLLVPPLQHTEAVRFVTFSADDRKLATISQGNAIRVWETATGRPICEPLQLRNPGVLAQFSPDSRTLIVLCADGTISSHTFVSPPPPVLALAGVGRVRSAGFSADGSRLVTAAASGLAQIWEVGSGKKQLSLQHGSALMAAALSRDGSQLVTAGTDQKVRLWDGRAGQSLGQPWEHSSSIYSVRFSADDRQLLVATRMGMGSIHEAGSTTRLLSSSSDRGFPIWNSAVVHPASDRVAGILVAGRAGAIFDRKTGTIIGEILKHSDIITSCNFSPDGRHVITSCIDNAAYVWDAETSRRNPAPLGHDGMVNYAAFGPDSRSAVTASNDKTARLWRIGEEISLTRTLPHGGRVHYAEFSPDGTRLLTVAADFTVHLWDVAMGRHLADPLQFKSSVVSAHFSPDGQTIFAASEDEEARLWSVPALPMPAPLWLADLAEVIGGSRIDDKGLIRSTLRHDLVRLKAALASPSDPYAAEARSRLFPSQP